MLHPSELVLRAADSLEIERSVPLTETFSKSIQFIVWSPSSDKILLASLLQVKVYSISNAKYSATISNPTAETAKVTLITFGATDDEVLVFADFGLKVSVFKLATSTAIDLSAPKLFSAASASRGFAYRPQSNHFTLLSRHASKDLISIHERGTYQVIRSWQPETVDAQSLSWSPDGKWLAVVESAAHGHKIIFHTADGDAFKVWRGQSCGAEMDFELGAGVRHIEWNSTGTLIAVADQSSKLTLLSVPQFASNLTLSHLTTIKPSGDLVVWQEQIVPSQSAGDALERSYAKMTQISAPPTSEANSSTAPAVGVHSTSFDTSGTFIATRVENMPTAVFIWDIRETVLKTVLIQHAPVTQMSWHPQMDGLLMIRCDGEANKGLVHVWSSKVQAPYIIDFAAQLPEGKLLGKVVARWLSRRATPPRVLFSDSQDFLIATLASS